MTVFWTLLVVAVVAAVLAELLARKAWPGVPDGIDPELWKRSTELYRTRNRRGA
jgi:hypothetical protein